MTEQQGFKVGDRVRLKETETFTDELGGVRVLLEKLRDDGTIGVVEEFYKTTTPHYRVKFSNEFWYIQTSALTPAPAPLQGVVQRTLAALQELYDATAPIERSISVASEDWHHDLFTARGVAAQALAEARALVDAGEGGE